jgi:hypothetical protein
MLDEWEMILCKYFAPRRIGTYESDVSNVLDVMHRTASVHFTFSRDILHSVKAA